MMKTFVGILMLATSLNSALAGAADGAAANLQSPRLLQQEAPIEGCTKHTVDFVLVKDNANLLAVEDDIRAMLARVGIEVNTRKLTKEEFNAAEQSGDFHLSFSETWGAPYDPHSYTSGWIAQDEGHYQALSQLEAPDSRADLFAKVDAVLAEEDTTARTTKWKEIHEIVHRNAIMLGLWGKRIPTVINNVRLTGYEPGYQQFDYPVNRLSVLSGSTTVTIAPGAQTGLFQSVGFLEPHTYRPNEFFSNNWVYEGLVKYGPFGQVLPALAEKWTIEPTGSGGERYIFQLRQNVTFHDGTPWDCSAAKINFDHVLAPPLRGADWHGWYGLVSQITGWTCPDAMTFEVTTKDKYYPFLQEMTFIRPLRMLSPAAFPTNADPLLANSCRAGWGNVTSEVSNDTVMCAGMTNISGTGPFMYVSREELQIDNETKVDTSVTFAANKQYYEGAPSIETLVIKRYENSAAVKAALLSGELDIVWGDGVLPATDLIELEQNGDSNNLSVFHTGDLQNVILLLNSGKAPLDNIDVRKTIIHAIDKSFIVENELGGFLRPVDNVFPTDIPYCDVDLTPRWDFDLEKAKFLNCGGDDDDDNSLALGLGLGIGLGCLSLILLGATIYFFHRSKKYEGELEELMMKNKGVNA